MTATRANDADETVHPLNAAAAEDVGGLTREHLDEAHRGLGKLYLEAEAIGHALGRVQHARDLAEAKNRLMAAWLERDVYGKAPDLKEIGLDHFDGFFLSCDELAVACEKAWPGVSACWSDSPLELVTRLIDERDEWKRHGDDADDSLGDARVQLSAMLDALRRGVVGMEPPHAVLLRSDDVKGACTLGFDAAIGFFLRLLDEQAQADAAGPDDPAAVRVLEQVAERVNDCLTEVGTDAEWRRMDLLDRVGLLCTRALAEWQDAAALAEQVRSLQEGLEKSTRAEAEASARENQMRDALEKQRTANSNLKEQLAAARRPAVVASLPAGQAGSLEPGTEEGHEEKNGHRLEWVFDGDGNWQAGSAIHDDGDPFLWRVTWYPRYGQWTNATSDEELLAPKDVTRGLLDDLDDVKEACQRGEDEAVAACEAVTP